MKSENARWHLKGAAHDDLKKLGESEATIIILTPSSQFGNEKMTVNDSITQTAGYL